MAMTYQRQHDVAIFVSNCKRGGLTKQIFAHFNEAICFEAFVGFFIWKVLPVYGRGRTNVEEFLRAGGNIINGAPSSFQLKEHASRSFRFVVSMENTIDHPFYVTEKIFNAYRAGALPLYLGPPEVRLFVPKHSFIDVSNYNDTQSLIDYLLYLKKNQTAYDEYMDWDLKEYSNRPWIKSKLLSTSWQCRLCSHLSS